MPRIKSGTRIITNTPGLRNIFVREASREGVKIEFAGKPIRLRFNGSINAGRYVPQPGQIKFTGTTSKSGAKKLNLDLSDGLRGIKAEDRIPLAENLNLADTLAAILQHVYLQPAEITAKTCNDFADRFEKMLNGPRQDEYQEIQPKADRIIKLLRNNNFEGAMQSAMELSRQVKSQKDTEHIPQPR